MQYIVIREPRRHLRAVYNTCVAIVDATSTRKAIDACPDDLRNADRKYYRNPEARTVASIQGKVLHL